MRLTELVKSGLICFLLVFATRSNGLAQNSFNTKFEKIVFGCYTNDIKDFEDFAIRAKKSGATYINLSNEDLPFSKWEYDTENDPYPAWVITNMGLLKIATPAALRPYLPQDYAESVFSILEERCKVLRKHGLKAAFKTFEPQMLPEKVYTDHPLWRGPRVDHPSRSRVARWAPDIDNPEVLKLYGESLSILLKRCPEIEILSLTTNDSGTGLSWSDGLYDGSGGNTFYKYRRTDERLFSFFSVLIEAAKNKGAKLEIDIDNTRENFPEKIAHNLSQGMAIEHIEGPEGKPFMSQVGFVMDYYEAFYPVMGLPNPVKFLEDLKAANNSGAKRLFVLLSDRFNKELYFKIYDKFNGNSTLNTISQNIFLKDIAKDKVGEPGSEQLLDVWLSLYEARKLLRLADFGGYTFYLGSVHQRWLTRPFVPFPEELKPQDRDYFRKYQFQAKSEEEANDMANTQATRIYAGLNASILMSRILGNVGNHVGHASSATCNLLKSDISPEQKKEFQLLDLRLRALNLMCNNANNAISYQAQLSHAKAIGIKPKPTPENSEPSGWERSSILETARMEIDNTALFIQLLESTNEVLIDLAPTKELEDIRRLGPDTKAQLKQKLRIMNERWLDYNRIFTTPNL